MRPLYRCCTGLDIHKDSISACIRIRVNGKAEAEIIEQRFIKLGSVASNIAGKSGRAMLEMLAAGSTDAKRMADRALGQLRIKMSELNLALDGRTGKHPSAWLRCGVRSQTLSDQF